MTAHRIFLMPFARVYPAYVQKAERKGRTREEVDQIIRWLTGYSAAAFRRQLDRQADFATFFGEAPALNPQRRLIQGVVCGVRVEEVEDPLMREIRYLDKLIDELAKGRPLEKILRQEAPAASPFASYHAKLSPAEQQICDRLAAEINRALPQAESKIWHAHPVWFLDGNPIVGYSQQKAGIRLMFWSGADFAEPGLSVLGQKFKDASVFYTDPAGIQPTPLRRWLKKAQAIQWDYKNLVRRKGKLERLK